jgi:choline dehydrogenase-like flavoprotein
MAEPVPVDPLDAATTRTVAALFDTVVPPDEWASGWAGGGERLLRDHLGDFLSWAVPALRTTAETLDAASGSEFADLEAPARARVLEAALATESGAADSREVPSPPDWAVAAATHPINTCVDLVFQAYYGGTREPAGWAMLGFNPLPDGSTPVDPQPLTGIGADTVAAEYDVIVVGGGGGGGFAAYELARRGQRVLLVERSRPFHDSELRGNHLQGKRQELYDVTAGPGKGSPRVLELDDGSTRLLPGDGSGTNYGLVAMALGGGTRVWQGMAWRFLAEDFRMASTYGVPEHSTLVDWPFSYDELEPYYERVEWELGVAGDSYSSAATRAPRTTALPMPALRDNGLRKPYSDAAARLGWQPSPIPTAINSVPRDGRRACVGCPQCVGHSCPVDAKNGTHNTVIPKALATGNCDLLMSTQVVEIVHDGRGNAVGVRAVHEVAGKVRELTVRARRVVVAAGAVETPRLLLASGIGNEWVGKNHHTHGGAAAMTTDAPVRKSFVGPNHSVATLDFVHAGGAPWGGGVVFDLPPTLPVAKAQAGRAVAPFGAAHKQWMREAPNALGTMSMVQEVPHELSRVSIDPIVRDRFGMPVARLRGVAHPASAAAAEFMRERCVEWVLALGGRNIESHSFPGGSRGAEHSAGSVRMGYDPASSACDPQGRVHGTSNVYVADASLHPTNGGFNPGLTAMACALRVADLML